MSLPDQRHSSDHLTVEHPITVSSGTPHPPHFQYGHANCFASKLGFRNRWVTWLRQRPSNVQSIGNLSKGIKKQLSVCIVYNVVIAVTSQQCVGIKIYGLTETEKAQLIRR